MLMKIAYYNDGKEEWGGHTPVICLMMPMTIMNLI